MALLLLSWSVWWIGRRIAPQRPSIALWSVVTLNLLPLINLASLVMDGAMVTASLVLLSVVAGWHALEAREIKGHENITPWFLFGVILGICTLFYYPICFLLLVVVAIRMISRGANSISWRSVIIAATLLVAGWVLPLIWNARHNWIQWSSVAYGFDAIHCGSVVFSLGLAVAVSAIMVPFLVRLAYAGKWWRGFLLFLGVIMASVSILFLLSPSLIPENLPSPIGVTGIAVLSKSVVALRAERPDVRGNKPFLIASTSGLASLLGEKILIDYPERPGAPSVFVAESPSLNNSFALWPCYAEAVSAGVRDPLYTEEKSVSPFMGRNALYITTESKKELPQTITGAFSAVALLKEVPITWNGHPMTVKIYQCEDYRSLSL